MRRRLIWMLGVLWAVAACAAPAPQPAGGSQEIIDALTRAHAAVVGVDVTAAEGARSADTLGHERSGSGVVIGPDGLILTIGYLMLEADTIEIETLDGHTFPAKAVAYDGATGFGLIKPLLPLPGSGRCRWAPCRTCRQASGWWSSPAATMARWPSLNY